MPAPLNPFKQALLRGDRQIGCWLTLAEAITTEIMGTAGFDWLVIDGEHAPNDLRSIRDQMLALAASPSHPVVRVPIGETWLIKQVLDLGAQTILVPMVESAGQARDLVRAMRYPPGGTRGVGAMGARATGFGAMDDYIQTVDGIDGVFIGPADLSTDMGYQGNAAAPEVQQAIADAVARIRAAGRTPGLLGITPDSTRAYADMGAQFLAVGIDALLLAQSARALAAQWHRL